MRRKSPRSFQPPRPTDAELAILRVLWTRGPSTVREVFDVLNEAREEPRAYTTVLRFLQIMTEKQLVVRENRDRTHIFAPKVPAERTQRQLVGDLTDRVFDGSVRDLVFHALGARKISTAELRDIRKLVNEPRP